ncbi:MAG: hypothetical protein U0797_17935 [Gemmataceae bacterium]
MYAGVPSACPCTVRALSSAAASAGGDPADGSGRPSALGQSPVQHDDLAEVAEDDVLTFEVAVDDAARVGVGDRVADRNEGVQQGRQVERVGLAGGSLLVERGRRLGQRAPLDEAHGVERSAVGGPGQLVDRDDAGVLQLAGNSGFLKEAGGERGVLGPLGPQLLQGDVAAEAAVVGQPHAADAARRVQSEPGVTIRGAGDVGHGGVGGIGPGQAGQGALDVVRNRREAGPGAAVLVQLAPEQVFDVLPVGLDDPAALDEQVVAMATSSAGPEQARPR